MLDTPSSLNAQPVGYDEKFQERLTDALIAVLLKESLVTVEGGPRLFAVRPAETVAALTTLTCMVLALNSEFDAPGRLHTTAKTIGKQIKVTVAKMRASGLLDLLGGAKGGRA